MRNTMLIYIDRFRHDRHSRRVLGSVLLVLAIAVFLTAYWQLRLHGIAITNETYCGYEEHVHTDECYETTLICGLDETEGHIHDESCYDEEGNLICGLEEKEAHTHTDECYEKTLVCELEEHTHTSDCLVDLEADVEDATVWEATLPELTGDLRTDIVNIAYSQIGYTESTANYTLADGGTTKVGYTRYGAWYGGLYYGSEYSDWDSLFVAFCLDYAGIAEDFTYNSGAYAWSVDLTALGYYQTADCYAPSTGDVVFIDTDADGRANITAIVVAVDESAQTITVIQGNYTVTDSEGDSIDTVALVTYSAATEIATQNEIVALSAGSEAEITPVILGYANVTYVTVTYVIEAEETEESEDEEEITLDEEESAEFIEEEVEEITVDETEADETETEEAEEETVLLTTASAVLTYDEYCSEAYSLYTYAMSITDSTMATSAWDSLMTLWDEIDAAYADGTITDEEYESLNDIMYGYYDEIYAYYTESIGYDPYWIMTAEDEGNAISSGNAKMYYYTSETDTETVSDSSASWTYTNNASYSDGELTVGLKLDFSVDKDSLGSDTTYYIDLPEDIVVPESALSGTHEGTDDNGNVAFIYQYIDNGDGTYSIAITYLASYLEKATDPVACYINYKSYIFDYDENDLGTDGVTITFEDGSEVTITYEEISSDDNESLYQDLTISKNASYYNASTNSITYTVTISSLTGTGVITLEDALSIVNNNSSLYSIADVTDISVTGVQYQIYTLSYTYENNGTTYYVYEWKNSDSVTVTESSSANSYTVPGYYYATDDDSESLTMTLSPLTGSGTDYTSDRYVITYTVTFDDSYSFDSKITNDAEASSTITTNGFTDTVTDEATVSRTVSSSMIDKTGSYSSETGLITYTIIFNDGGNDGGIDIAGYVLTDTALIGIDEDDVTVYYLDGTSYKEADSSEYTIDATTGTITFSDSSSNTKTYKIVYTVQAEPSGFTSSTSVYNEVTVKTGDTTVDKDYTTVNVYSNGTVDKELDTASEYTYDGSTYTRILTWTSTITVPSAGIAAGTVISDYLGTWSGDTFSYTYGTSSTHQWFTYDQIVADFFAELISNGIIITTNDNPVTIKYEDTGEDDADGNDIYTFTLEAYDITCGKWLTYSEITEGSHTSCLFTAYRITLNTAVTTAGTITLSYSNTADITDVMGDTTKRDYYNYISVGSKSDTANYTEYDTVYKTNAYGVSSDTTVTATTNGDGTVTWIVNVLIPEGATAGDFTITDTLPAGVTLETLKINIGSETVEFTTTDNVNYTATVNSTTANAVVNTADNTVEITIPYNAYSSMVDKTGAYIAVTYTCTIDDWSTWYGSNPEVGEKKTYTLKNSVSVTWGTNDNYGSNTQTQTIVVTYEEKTEETDHDVVEKSVDATGVEVGQTRTNKLDYSVVLNLDKQNLDDGDYLEFVDTLEYYDYSEMTLNLMTNTVTFYELIELEPVKNNSDEVIYYHCTYTDSDGNTQSYAITPSDLEALLESTTQTTVYKYTESDSTTTYYYMLPLDITWNFSTGYDWRTLYYITATVPDETAILVTYSYYVADAITETDKLYIKNTATLTGTTTSSGGEEVKSTYEETELTAGVYSSGGYTLIKSGTSTSDFLPDAVFQLYVYDATSGDFVPVEYTETEISTYNLANGVDYIVDGTHYYAIYTTNSYGTITVSPYAVYDIKSPVYWEWYKEDLLYYLVEIEAPEGYILDGDTKYYFYWESDDSTGISGLTSDITAQNLTEDASSSYVSNLPITTFTLTKVSSSDSSAKLEGAEFYLYEYVGIQYNGNTYTYDDVWNYLGTYTTDEKGEISITYDSDVYSFDTAYMLKEVSAPDGYSAGYNDNISFYFYWDEDETDGFGVSPSNWGTGTDDDGTTYATATNLASGDVTVYATNTKTNTSVSVTKVWLDSTGNVIDDPSDYTATVQLYYYLSTEKPSSSSTSSGDYETVTLYSNSTLSSNTISSNQDYASWYEMTGAGINNITTQLSSDTNSYLQITIEGASSINDLKLYLQDSSSTVIGTLSTSTGPSYSSGTYTVTFCYDDIVAALRANNKTLNALNNFYIMNGTNGSGGGTITNISVLSDYEVKYTSSESKEISSTNSWVEFLKQDSNAQAALATDGALIRVNYTCTTDGTSTFGIISSTDSTQYYATTTALFSTSGSSFTVAVSDLSAGSGFDINDYYALVFNSQNKDVVATIDSIEILVPYDSSSSGSSTTTSTETLLEITSAGELDSTWYSGNNVLADEYDSSVSTKWSALYAALTSDEDAYIEVVISGSSTAYPMLQFTDSAVSNSYPNVSVSGSTYTIDSDGNYVYRFNASDILNTITSTVAENPTYSAYKICIAGISDSATLISAAVKVDNEVSTSGTSVDGSYDVTLYTWTPSSTVTISGGYSASSYTWNEISTWENDEVNIRWLLDAIYANLESNVYITVSNLGTNTTTDDLYKLQLIIQGDTSVGESGYETILTIEPDDVQYNSTDGTYTLIYSSAKIRAQLLGSEGKYQDAASVYADYLKLILSFATSDGDSATLNSIEVVTTDELSLSSTYSKNFLLGETTYSGARYYDAEDYGEYTLEEDNNWTETVTALPISYTDDNNVTWYYYYYFVETSVSENSEVLATNKYETTYSQTEGENTGGEIVITNVIAETTEVTVEKKWVDGNGDDVSADFSTASIDVDLYYYLVPVDDSGGTSGGEVDIGTTIDLYFGNGHNHGRNNMGNESTLTYIAIPVDTSVTISISLTNTSSWFALYAESDEYGNNSTEVDTSSNNTATYTETFIPSSGYEHYYMQFSDGTLGTITVVYTVDGVTYTNTYADSGDGETWTWTTTTTTSANANAVALSASTSDTSIATLLASIEAQTPTVTALSATDTVTLYIGSAPDGSTYLLSIYSTIPCISIPSDVTSVDVTISSNDEDSTYTYYGLYSFLTSTVSECNPWGGDSVCKSETYFYQSPYVTEITKTISISETYPIYYLAYTTIDGETISVTYNDVTYTTTYSATNGTWSAWVSSGETGGETGGDEPSTVTGYTESQLLDGVAEVAVHGPELYGSYTISATYDDETDTYTWSYIVDGLPAYITFGNVTYAYYYYFVETGTTVSGVYASEALYSTDTGVTSGTITITNTVSDTSTVTTLPESYSVDYTTMYEFGAMLILVSLVGAGAYRNISRIRKSLVEEPHRDRVDPGGTHERLPDVRNRKFVIPRIVRKGDTRAGPEDDCG
ncbi:MAG: prealbumin-like fold domain-containing protein [Oscillospiraceae bacterium]|nr:prealbumin-like fold domain-containing protein [Oscillospiraceae bacterium]